MLTFEGMIDSSGVSYEVGSGFKEQGHCVGAYGFFDLLNTDLKSLELSLS